MNKTWKVFYLVQIGSWIGMAFLCLYGWYMQETMFWPILAVVCYMMAFMWAIIMNLEYISEKLDNLQNEHKVKGKDQ